MIRIGTCCVALALVICAADRADARCAVFLDGDAEIVDEVRAELDRFEDDGGPCLTLRAVLDGGDRFIGVDLRDELGRAAQRGFESPAGVAAFLVSWSRRPMLPSPIEIAAPVRLPPVEAPTRAVSHPRRWHPEIAAAYWRTSATPGDFGEIVSLASSLTYHVGIVRAGGAVAGLLDGARAGRDAPSVLIDLLGTLGLGGRVWKRVPLRAELVVGAVLAADGSFADRAMGYRRGVRAAIGFAFAPALALELGIGYEWATLNGWPWAFQPDGESIEFAHAEVGIRWSP